MNFSSVTCKPVVAKYRRGVSVRVLRLRGGMLLTQATVARRIAWIAVLVVVLAAGLFVWREGARQAQNTGSLQQRVLAIAAQLRVPSEQDTMTAASSPEPQAEHMRYEIQQDLLSGDSKSAIINKMVQEYGANVLAAPRARGIGGLVWFLPLVVLVVGLLFLIRYLKSIVRGKPVQRADVTRASVSPRQETADVQPEVRKSIDAHLHEYL